MKKGDAKQTAPRTFSESRTVFPFQRSDLTDGVVRFRAGASTTLKSVEEWLAADFEFSPEAFADPAFAPEFEFDVDATLADVLALPADDIVISIVLEDRAAWLTETIARWPLSSVPKSFKAPASIRELVAGNKGIAFIVQAMPSERSSAAGFEPGDRIASVRFDLRTPADGHEFPTELVDDERFAQFGLPANTVWAIDWKNDDFDVPLEDALVVLVSKAAYGKLVTAQTGFGKVLWHAMGCEILTEIAYRYLLAAPSEAPPKTLGFMVANALRQGSGKDLAKLFSEAKQRDALTRVRAYVQAALALREEIVSSRARGSSS